MEILSLLCTLGICGLFTDTVLKTAGYQEPAAVIAPAPVVFSQADLTESHLRYCQSRSVLTYDCPKYLSSHGTADYDAWIKRNTEK